jgi:hypothetical protein
MRRFPTYLGVLVAAAPCLDGCAAVPLAVAQALPYVLPVAAGGGATVGSSELASREIGSRFNKEKLDKIRIGRSSKEDVIQAFGEPHNM